MMTDMFLQIDNSKVWNYAFALTGRRLSTHFIPRVSLRLPWAMRSLGFTFPLRAGDGKFSPLCLNQKLQLENHHS